MLDPQTGLPTYTADSNTGLGYGPSRGVGVAFMLIWAPELWPDTADEWYASFDNHFWQENIFLVGFREFASDSMLRQWFLDVDAGPVVAGYGTAATAFGLGAARVTGRIDQAYPLTAQALAASWPLPNGTRLGPRLLSNLSGAPFVGDAALLFALTRQPATDILLAPKENTLMLIFYLIVALYLGLGAVMIGQGIASIRRVRINGHRYGVDSAELQFIAWIICASAAFLLIFTGHPVIGMLLLLSAQLLPVKKSV
jgi:hypothetical protein